jgi:hypothetical protein
VDEINRDPLKNVVWHILTDDESWIQQSVEKCCLADFSGSSEKIWFLTGKGSLSHSNDSPFSKSVGAG